MNLTTVALAGMLMAPAQVPADLYSINDRDIKIPIRFDPELRAQIQQVKLFVSRGEDQPWQQAGVRTPNENHFPFSAPSDGIYWFNVQVIDRHGRSDPANLYEAAPQLKVLVDTVKPVVRIKSAESLGGEVLLAWEVSDDYLDPSRFKIEYAIGGASATNWLPGPTVNPSSGQAKFAVAGRGEIWVRVTAADFAGNTTEVSRPVNGTATEVAAEVAPPAVPTPPELPPTENLIRPPQPTPAMEQPAMHSVSVAPSDPDLTRPQFPGSPELPGTPEAAFQPEPTFSSEPAPRPQPQPQPQARPDPVAVSGEAQYRPAPSRPAATPLPDVQVINVLQFDLGYSVDNTGPSGVGRVDLWVTRDDGRTWTRWATDEDKQSPITVDLDTQFNRQPEGVYGFRIVVQSGAGLGDDPPVAGDPPELRVHVDLTRPVVKLWNPTPDPSRRDTLILTWEAIDQNLAERPISLEWSDAANGPWRPIGPDDETATARMGLTSDVRGGAVRLPNTGKFAWRVPQSMPTHRVYLRVSAIDLAGNEGVVVTPDPIEIDLNKPQARIQGIVGAPVLPR